MPESDSSPKPLVASVCGTFLKPEMQSIYRQVTGLKRFRTIVFTEQQLNAEQFPFEPIEVLTKLLRPKPRGNFLLRLWFKHIVKKWPPPFRIEKDVKPYYPFDLLPRLAVHKPDLIHIYYGHKAVTYKNILLKTEIPFIVSFHGVDVAHFAKGDRNEDFEAVLDRAKLVLARSQSLLDELASLGVDREKLRLNRTPIPLDGIEAEVRSAPEDGAWRLIQACRLIPKKGILTAIEALKPVCERWPKLKYLLCGTGPQDDEIRAAAEQAGLTENVELLGWLDQDQLRAEFAKAHAFLHPSELTESSDQEGVPNSMLEAMAAGLPVIATQHGGIPEAVESGVDGLLVPEKLPRELGEAIQQLLGDADLLASLSRQARASVVEKFDARRQVAAMENCYAEAIQEPK
ncbi:MAG: colanic acid/amylovoran biosynthesis glycosyltransferase [Verrucomicrobiales bacterium]|jgi:colanic acid/amylovoran biosynthesis glycosyltransferase